MRVLDNVIWKENGTTLYIFSKISLHHTEKWDQELKPTHKEIQDRFRAVVTRGGPMHKQV
jgi:hypothetical protein